MNLKISSPLEQFEVHPLLKFGIGFLDLSLTNATFTLFILLSLFLIASNFSLNEPTLVGKRWQNSFESLYGFITQMVKEQIGEKGMAYLPLIFTLFTFLLLTNLGGMVPYSFTVTAQIVITFFLSLTIFIGVTILGFAHHRLSFFSLLLPPGASLFLAPLLIVIELISYFARAISLAVRLAANMMAGHTLLHIVASFIWKMILAGGILTIVGIAPLALLSVLLLLELAIAILQAYVFTVLTCTYLKDALYLH